MLSYFKLLVAGINVYTIVYIVTPFYLEYE